MRRLGGEKVRESFVDASGVEVVIRPARRKSQPKSRLSVRVDEAERAYLETRAGDLTLSTYVRERLLGDYARQSRTRPARRLRKPKIDQTALAQVLAALGQSRLASNLNQIAKLANIGALPVTPELTEELHAACDNIREMRDALMRALGMPS